MSTLSSLGARALQTPLFPTATQQTSGKTGRSQTAAATTGNGSSGSSPVSLSDDSILQNRAASLGSATVDYAQSLLNSFTQQALGDASKGETISFDSVSLDTSSSFAEAAQQGSGGSGSAAAGLSDSSHFIGKGTITTADGRTFDFEVEVQYSDKLEVGASQGNGTDTADATSPDALTNSTGTAPAQSGAQSANSTGTPSDTSSDTSGLPTVQLPSLDFDGGLADLFQLIGRQIQSGSSSSDSSANSADAASNTAGTSQTDPFKALSLRLLKLVDASNDTGIYSPSTPASSAANAKSLASTYGTPATTASTATPATSAAATAPAAGTTDSSSSSAATPVTAATDTPINASA